VVTALAPRAVRLGLSGAAIALVIALAAALSPTPSPAEEPAPDVQPSAVVSTPQQEAPAQIVTPALRLRTCQVSPPDSVAGQREVFGAVALASTGEILWRTDAESPTVPASVIKLVTASAALDVLGPDFRFVTRVVEGEEPGQLWLVGGGDPTLSRTLPGQTTFYTEPPRLRDIADQVVAYVDRDDTPSRVSVLGVDTERYRDFPEWNDNWRSNAWSLGFMAPVTAFMVDGGRLSPQDAYSARTRDPVDQATRALIDTIRQAGGSTPARAESTTAPEGTAVVAEVFSQPLPVLLDQMIRQSDNQIAEALIREVALALSTTDFDKAARAGLPQPVVASAQFYADDGSGLSSAARMSAELAAAVVVGLVNTPEAEIIVSSFAVPQEQGTLQRRFSSNAELAQALTGKTGTLQGVRSLAGVIDGDDPLVFAVFLTGSSVTDSSRTLIDSLVAQFYDCGENLAHWREDD
jgi:serine-type D-Ala-D-Ala carboxypeptidase/endopeptidase (penicillin-binding protein 4)